MRWTPTFRALIWTLTLAVIPALACSDSGGKRPLGFDAGGGPGSGEGGTTFGSADSGGGGGGNFDSGGLQTNPDAGGGINLGGDGGGGGTTGGGFGSDGGGGFGSDGGGTGTVDAGPVVQGMCCMGQGKCVRQDSLPAGSSQFTASSSSCSSGRSCLPNQCFDGNQPTSCSFPSCTNPLLGQGACLPNCIVQQFSSMLTALGPGDCSGSNVTCAPCMFNGMQLPFCN